MSRLKYLIFILIIALVSCKKKTYPESKSDNTKTFYFNANIDGVAVSLEAGSNNYYMYSSFVQDANNVYQFSGDLREAECGSCTNRIQIKINDFKASAINSPAQINQSLSPKNYSLIAGPAYEVKFQAIYNKTAAGYLWNFGDGLTAVSSAPTHTFTKEGIYNMSLKINSTNSCNGSINTIEKIGYPLKNYISAVNDSLNAIHFYSNTQGATPFSYLWNFGDGGISTVANPTHTYLINGSYPITLRVIDFNQDTVFSNYNAVTKNDQSSCATNYSITSITPIANPLSLSGINIVWTDASGTVYNSNNALQPSSSYFKIVSVDTYDNNEKSETTKKLTVQFNCRVYNGTNYKTINNANAVICVSYK